MNWRDPEFRRNLLVLGSWKNNGSLRRLIAISIMVISLIAFGSFWSGFPFATDPSLCGQMCHATYAEYQSWSQSTHKDVPCHYCHLDSPSEKVINPITRAIMTRFDNFNKPINADSSYSQKHVSSQRCLFCHADSAPNRSGRPVPRPKGAIHKKHTSAGLKCTTCHNRIAHLGAERFQLIATWKPKFTYPDFMDMREGCWRCHSVDGRWRNQETLDVVGGAVLSTECGLCHKDTWIRKPRQGRISHEDLQGVPWRLGERHGREATKDFFACLGCHDRKPRPAASQNPPDCSYSCHGGIVMPHNSPTFSKYNRKLRLEPEWIDVHSTVAAREGVVKSADGIVKDPNGICVKCHDRDSASENFCDACHHRDVPGPSSIDRESTVSAGQTWRLSHRYSVKTEGTPSCQKCHSFDFCTDCHTGVKSAR